MRLAENTGRKKGAKNRHLGAIAQLCRAISSHLRQVSTIGKNLLSRNMSSTCPHNMVNFGQLTAEIGSGVWGTRANFKRVSRLGSVTARHLVVDVSQTLRRWTEGATYVRQGDHHVGHCPHSSFFFSFCLSFFPRLISAVGDWMSAIYFHTWCDLSANLGCRSEACSTRLAENAGRKKSPKNRHLRTILQLCQAIGLPSQLRH